MSINSIKMDTPKKKRYSVGLQSGYGIMLGSPIRSGFYIGGGIDFILFGF
jgi:hypothetical protein